MKRFACMGIHNPDRHTPRHLWEALSGNPEYDVQVRGDAPANLNEEDEELPPGAVD